MRKQLTSASKIRHGGVMTKEHPRGAIQFAALPWRSDGGRHEVMLVTSRETRRWVIPKGWPIKGLKAPEVARREAHEEAGVIGQIVGKQPIGDFHYAKRLPTGSVLCQVLVYLFWVEQQLDEWPEKGQRVTQWFDPHEAASLVDEGGLAEIIARFGASYLRVVAFRRPTTLVRCTSAGVGGVI